MLDSVSVDLKSLAAGERPEPDDAQAAPARPSPASEALPSRLAVLDALADAARLFEGLAEACDVNAERLKVEAREAEKRKQGTRLFSDAAAMKERATAYRAMAAKQVEARRWVLHHGDTEARRTA